MIYGLIFGTLNMISFVYTNNKLQQNYYCELAKSKDKWKISPEILDSLNDNSSWFPLNHNYRGKYILQIARAKDHNHKKIILDAAKMINDIIKSK